jgi:hypothetical protein
VRAPLLKALVYVRQKAPETPDAFALGILACHLFPGRNWHYRWEANDRKIEGRQGKQYLRFVRYL